MIEQAGRGCNPVEQPENLNRMLLQDQCGAGAALRDPGGRFYVDGYVEVYFRDIERSLLEKIDDADYVFGCVAWLTHTEILKALAKKKGVCIVVQKEDFLRPDVGHRSGFAQRLRGLYDSLPPMNRDQFPALAGMSTHDGERGGMSAVRCVGNVNIDKRPAHPRAHHKFVLFAERCPDPRDPDVDDLFTVRSVWTGSFNFSKNAAMSLENAVVLNDARVASAFYQEFQQIAGLSEPLDWETPWAAPQWRIGS